MHLRYPAILLALTLATPTLLSACGDDGGGGSGSETESGGDGDGDSGDGDSAGDGDGDSGACGADGSHLVFTEVVTSPSEAEFIEIHNLNSAPVALGHYYLSDSRAYYQLTAGLPLESPSSPGTDFSVRFPDVQLPPGATIVISTGGFDGGSEFFDFYGRCPDFAIASSDASCEGDPVPTLEAAVMDGAGDRPGQMLSNNDELVILSCWDGESTTLLDVDYVAWGSDDDVTTRVDKSGVEGYAPDTAAAQQRPAPAHDPAMGQASIARCASGLVEVDETSNGGNGIGGHDETSEDLANAFTVQGSATPGSTDCL